ncbi:MAG: tetratricopeptide repeat protein [Acidobacteria bacterium]|nr:tetratricopeptide repeat protein [Acidobacteriota bacterium]MCA1611008.1 tetratricopeptide repeat protein [Acidobacteriota bacterium]
MGFRTLSPLLSAALFVSLAGSVSAQEWRGGRVRVEGFVKNEKGEPIEGARVHLRWKQHPDGPDLVTDKKGKWAMLGLASGAWNIDFEAPGYQTRQIAAQLKETERNPPIDVQLQALQPAPAAREQEQILVGGSRISKETSEAIDKANAAFGAKKYAEARENYALALTEIPANAPLLMRLAASYYGEGNFEKAIQYARLAADKDPQDPTPWRLIAELELQGGNLEAGQAALSRVPEDKIKDGQPYLNIGILLLNKKKTSEAEAALSKAVAVQPGLADAYYMRALARIQLKKKSEARADLEKYLQLAPNGTEARDARDMLKTLS